MTALKSLLYLIFEAGLFALYVPLALLRTGPRIEAGTLSFLAIPLWLIGCLMVVWCFQEFLVKGRGTPVPVEPPKELVVTGLYRYMRNPLYMGVLFIFIGHFLWFGFWYLLIYAALALIATQLFIIFYEEPNLRKRFGKSYEDYLLRVPRWIPHLPRS